MRVDLIGAGVYSARLMGCLKSHNRAGAVFVSLANEISRY